jgi:hypothetical protein
MGGLTATYLLKALDRGRRLRSVVTLGTPQQGTPLARLGALVLGRESQAVWQMLPGCPFIEELASLGTPPRSRLVSIAGGRDWIVPQHSARVRRRAGQINRTLPDVGHTEMLVRREVFEVVESAISEDQRTSTSLGTRCSGSALAA